METSQVTWVSNKWCWRKPRGKCLVEFCVSLLSADAAPTNDCQGERLFGYFGERFLKCRNEQYVGGAVVRGLAQKAAEFASPFGTVRPEQGDSVGVVHPWRRNGGFRVNVYQWQLPIEIVSIEEHRKIILGKRAGFRSVKQCSAIVTNEERDSIVWVPLPNEEPQGEAIRRYLHLISSN
jgi:hypothetical protein